MGKQGRDPRTRLTRRGLLRGAAAMAGTAAAGFIGRRDGLEPRRALAAAAPRRGGQVIVGFSQEPVNFNPVMPYIEVQRGIHMDLFDAFWRLDPAGRLIPNLAVEIPTVANGGITNGGLAFTIKLRRDVKWHDGQPLTAKDAVFTWQTIMNPKVTSATTVGYDDIAAMDAPDDYTVRFTLKEPYAPIMALLSDTYLVPEHILGKSADINKDDFNTKRPVGSGAFKFVEWAAGDHITLEANRAYHGPGPYLDRLVYKYIPDLTVMFTQYRTREIDVTGIQGIPIDLYPEAKKLPASQFKVLVTPSTTYESVALNFLNPLFQDRRLRQSLYYGMDKRPIVNGIFQGLVQEAETYVPPQSWAYDPKVKGAHKYNPDLAKELLERAGWMPGSDGIRVKNGQRLSFDNSTTAGNKVREQIQQILQQQWRQIGVEMKINNMPASVLFGDFYRLSRFQSVLIGIAMGPDPDHSYRIHSKYIPVRGGKGRNGIAYANPEVDRLLDAGLREIDQAKRKAIYAKLQEVLVIDLPHLPVYHYIGITGINARLQGYAPNPNVLEGSWNSNTWWMG